MINKLQNKLIKFLTFGFAFSATLLIWGCGGQKGGGGGFQMPPTLVEVATATSGSVADKFETVGTLDAGEQITVVAEIAGRVKSLPFQEGGAIGQGGLIAELDDDQLSAEMTRAEAVRDQRLSEFNRVKAIVDQNAGSQQDLDNATANLKVAEADFSLQKSMLAKTRIRAPFSGILGARNVSVGAYVTPGQSITDLAKIDELRINFSIPEKYLGELTKGAEVIVTTTAYPDYELKGKIDVVEPVLDQATRSTKVVAKLKNPDKKFRPGMSANVSAVLSERGNAITVISEAVFVEGTQSYVYVIKPDCTVTKTALTLGTRLKDSVEVLKGLSSGAKVVRAGHQKLYEGAHIMPAGQPPQGGAGQKPADEKSGKESK